MHFTVKVIPVLQNRIQNKQRAGFLRALEERTSHVSSNDDLLVLNKSFVSNTLLINVASAHCKITAACV